MSKMTGVFRPQPKISEAELAIARERTAARLEDLFGRRDGSAEHAGQIPLQRPPIIVEEGSDLIGLPSEHDTEARFDVHEDPAPAEVIAFMESPSATPELVTVVVAPTPDAELVGVMEHPALLEPMAPGSEAGAGPAPDDGDVVSPSIVEDPVDLAPGSASGTQMTLGAGPPEPTGPLAAAVDPVDQLAARDVREDATTAPPPVAHQARVVTGAEASDRSGRVAVDEAAAYREALRQAFWYAAPLTPARAIAPPAAHPRTTPMTPTPTPTTPPQNDAANGAVASPQVTPDREPAELVPAVTIASQPVAPSADRAVRQDARASAPDAPVESLVASPVKAARASRTAGPRRARLAPTTTRPPEERPPTAPPPEAAAPPPEAAAPPPAAPKGTAVIRRAAPKVAAPPPAAPKGTAATRRAAPKGTAVIRRAAPKVAAPAPKVAAPAPKGTAAKRARLAHPAEHHTPVAGSGQATARLSPVVLAALCPSCALLLQPPPSATRRCPRCRQQIVVKRFEGQTAYLTEAAVAIFEAERRKVSDSGRFAREREKWLKLAIAAGAPTQKTGRMAAANPCQEVVDAARQLYLATVDRAFKAAKHDHAWKEASRIRRDQAAALHRLAGSPLPPPDDLLALYREGVAAELRGLAEIVRDAELIGATCCDPCRADNGRVAAISKELAAPRLPHEGCPKVFCRCSWDLARRDRDLVLRYLRRRPRAGARPSAES